MRLIITDTARADLRNIRKHIAKDNPNAAKIFTKDLIDKLYNLAASGVIGSPRDNIKLELHAFPYRGRCFYLHIVDDKMFVIRILHGAQDITAQEFPYNTKKQ